MALSDACFEFLCAVNEAASELAKAIHFYSEPDYPISYGEEIDALRRACSALASSPYDGEKGAHLVRLAGSVLHYLDTPPDAKYKEHQKKIETLINLLESSTESIDASDAHDFVVHLILETPFTKRTIERLRIILPTLTQTAYEEIIDILNEIGCAIVKRHIELDLNFDETTTKESYDILTEKIKRLRNNSSFAI